MNELANSVVQTGRYILLVEGTGGLEADPTRLAGRQAEGVRRGERGERRGVVGTMLFQKWVNLGRKGA